MYYVKVELIKQRTEVEVKYKHKPNSKLLVYILWKRIDRDVYAWHQLIVNSFHRSNSSA